MSILSNEFHSVNPELHIFKDKDGNTWTIDNVNADGTVDVIDPDNKLRVLKMDDVGYITDADTGRGVAELNHNNACVAMDED